MKKQVLVSINDSHMDRIATVIEELKKEGLDVQRSMPKLGVVSGAAEHGDLAALQEVDGVTSVEEERSVEVAPPDAPVQ
jgi:methylmalonyl-CoA mutase cobalamin-binding subunit